MAIAGLICAFFIPLLGLIFSIIGINQTKDNKRGGRGLAIAGLIISAIGMLLGLLWIILIVVAAANTDTSNNTYSSSNSSLSSLTSDNKTVTGKIGEPVTVEDVVLTVGTVSRNYMPTSQFFEPSAGKEYVSVSVELKNNGSDSVSFGTYSFKLRDSSGLEVTSSYVGEVAGELQSGSLAANGGNTKGVIIFEVTKDDPKLVLVYEPSFLGNTAEVSL
jgi:flagellar basal body rod protein FlgC